MSRHALERTMVKNGDLWKNNNDKTEEFPIMWTYSSSINTARNNPDYDTLHLNSIYNASWQKDISEAPQIAP